MRTLGEIGDEIKEVVEDYEHWTNVASRYQHQAYEACLVRDSLSDRLDALKTELLEAVNL